MSITSVRVVVGDTDELERLRKENKDHKATVNQSWEEFEQLARTKGLRTLTAISEAVGADLEYLRSCKSHGRVSRILLQKLAEVDDKTGVKKRKLGSTLGKMGERFQTLKRREQELRIRERNPRYLALKQKYLDLTLAEGDSSASDMTVNEMNEVCRLLFGDVKIYHQAVYLSGITGYSVNTHALQLRGKRNIPVSLAVFLRHVRSREAPQTCNKPQKDLFNFEVSV